jgi:hypothetical protein
LLIGAEPIECVPGVWPVLDEQAPTNRPVRSSANAASDMVIFFFIYCLVLDAEQVPTQLTTSDTPEFSRCPKKQAFLVLRSAWYFTELGLQLERTTIKAADTVRTRLLFLFDQAFDANCKELFIAGRAFSGCSGKCARTETLNGPSSNDSA